MTLDLNWSRYTTNELVLGFHDRLHARLAGQPGVIATASSLTFPLDGHRRINVGFVIEGQPPAEDGAEPLGDLRSATPEYFQTLGIPLVTGRFFTAVRRARLAQRRDREPDARAPVLGQGNRGRPPDLGRQRQDLDHDRRRGGRRAPLRPRQRAVRRGVPAVRPAAVPRGHLPGPHLRRSRRDGPAHRRGSAGDRSRPAARQRADAGGGPRARRWRRPGSPRRCC